MSNRRRTSAGVVALVFLVSLAVPTGVGAAAPTSCGGPEDASFSGHQVIGGEFGSDLQGSYVMVPFSVPAGSTGVRVRYCYDQPDFQIPGSPFPPSNTLDLGVYEPRGSGGGVWGKSEFRGWAGSSARDVTISPNGFSDEATYLGAPKGYVHGRTTRGYVPGPIPAGRWAVELGVASVVSPEQGNSDGKVAWRVEVDTTSSPDFADHPYRPTPYNPAPAVSEPGWYAGDFHVHGEEELGNTLMRETLDYAFTARDQGGAGLDFVTLVDHNNVVAYGEIGRLQPDYPGKLIGRSTEVTTYRGHLQNHASGDWVDYRTSPIYEWGDDGSLQKIRDAVPASSIFDAIHAGGGYTQINHPTIFPSQVPGFAAFCRGCPWDYTETETDYSKVEAIEVATGPAGLVFPSPLPPLDPGPNPFTPLALQFYEQALDTGAHIAPVGGSDSHHGGDVGNPPDSITTSPDGVPTTMVYAQELSEQGIEDAVRAGHTYVKVEGRGPDLRFEATAPGQEDAAIMGDTLRSESAEFEARVIGAMTSERPGPYLLVVVKDGRPLFAAPVAGDDFSVPFPSLGVGRYRLELMRLSGVAAIDAVSSPIYLDPDAPLPPDDDGNGGGHGGGDGGKGGGGSPPEGPAGAAACAAMKSGGDGGDRLSGSDAGDSLLGLGGNDRLKGLRGEDCLYGMGGRDRLFGGPDRDRLFGGPGRDRIGARDGYADVVNCGAGRRDRAVVDRIDRVRGCEVVGPG